MLLGALLAGLLGFALCALITARCAYGVQRARTIARESLQYPGADPVARFEAQSRDATATAALLFGLAWPVTVPCYGVYRGARFLIMAHPRETEYDRVHRARQREARIRRLEDALGMEPEPRPEPPASRRSGRG
jgi:hypothetical protein